MNNYINETVIRDVVNIMGDIKNSDIIQTYLKRGQSHRSIASASQNLTLVYPFGASEALTIDTVSLLSKAQERKNAQMLQLLFAAYQTTTLNKDEDFDPVAYLSKFHKNIRMGGEITVDNVFDTIDSVVKLTESMQIETSLYGEKCITLSEQQRIMKNDMVNINYVLPESISEEAICNYKTKKMFGEYHVIHEADSVRGNNIRDNAPNRDNYAYRDVYGNVIRDENGNPYLGQYRTDMFNDDFDNYIKSQNIQLSADEYELRRREFGFRVASQQNQDRFSQANIDIARANSNSNIEKNRIANIAAKQQIGQNVIAQQLQNADVRKANELIGTPMMITVHVTRDANIIEPVSFLIAIKSKIYPMSSADIRNRFVTKNRDNNFFAKLVKVSTGEISFVSDFLFAIDTAKIDALSHSRKGSSSKLWKVLERSAIRSKLNRRLGIQNQAMAVTTICVSQDEVEYMKKYERMDLEDVRTARQILESYNLLSSVIADETNEVAKFIYNTGDDVYETISFNMLEKEASDGSYRKMVNLMTKIR